MFPVQTYTRVRNKAHTYHATLGSSVYTAASVTGIGWGAGRLGLYMGDHKDHKDDKGDQGYDR